MLLAAILVVGAIVWAGRQIAQELKMARDEASSRRALDLVQLFAPGIAASHADPRALLVWQPLARTARQLFPREFATLDSAAGATFPFTKDQFEKAHARWTADWLAWEGAHDAEYKLRAAAMEQEVDTSGASRVARARIEAVEREKLELYQRRYEEYIRVAKALQTLAG